MANYRVFKAAGLIAWLDVAVGPEEGRKSDRSWHQYDIDPDTGLVAIPAEFLPANAPSKGQFLKGRYVQAFKLCVSHPEDDDVLYVVTQRSVDNDYKRQLPGTQAGNLHTYNFAAVPVEWRERDDNHKDAEGRTGPAIFTAMKSKGNDSGTNRVDVWIFKKDGSVWLYQILIVSFDDGKSFNLVGNYRGIWKAHRLEQPMPYLPQTDKAVLRDSRVLSVLDKLIFEPEGACTGIDNRAEVFENNKVLDYLDDNMAGFGEWNGDERNFSTSPTIEGVQLSGNRGYLKWFSHGLSGCGMGIVVGADGVERQVRYHCFGDDVVKDSQGLLEITDGDVIEWEGQIAMGYNERAQRNHPALLYGVRVQLIGNERRRAKGILPQASTPAAA